MNSAAPEPVNEVKTGTVGTLAFAGDLSMGQPIDHSARTAWLSQALCAVLGLGKRSGAVARQLALLRWSGCTANAEEFSDLFGDDIGGRAALVEARDPFVGRAPPPAGIPLGPIIAPLSVMHCETVAFLARRLRLDPRVPAAARDFFELWDGSGLPSGRVGDWIDPHAQVVTICGDLEVWSRLHGLGSAFAMLRDAAGVRHDPSLTRVVLRHAGRWLADLARLDAWAECAAALPSWEDDLDLDAAVGLLSDYVELKVPADIGCASRAAALAHGSGAWLGVDGGGRIRLRRAARLHRLGTVSVPNVVLQRAEAPGEGDREALALVPHWTQRTLGRMPALAREARLASTAFERLDGSGHHRALEGAELRLESRILAACVVAAEEGEDALITQAQRGWLDAHVCDAVRTVMRDPDVAAPPARDTADAVPALTPRERDVLGHLIRGLSNKQIARALHVSPSTVGTHVENLYRKLGVSNRATATLWALENNLGPS